MRAYELARELKVSNNHIKLACGALDKPIKSHMTEMEDALIDEVREFIANADAEDINPEKPAKKEMTKPWADKPWSLDMFKLKKKHVGFRPRFTTREKLQEKLDQGWRVADAKDYGDLTAVLPGEESTEGSVIRRKEMVLIEIPEAKAKEREEFIDWKSNQRAKDARKMAENQARKIEQALGDSSRFVTSSNTTKGY